MLTMKWRSIETAPKDGTLLLLYAKSGDNYHMRTGYYNDAPRLGNYPKWRWELTIEPTHWMPLPKPPDGK